MAKFTFVKDADNTEIPYATKSVDIQEQIVVTTKKSLWNKGGIRLSLEQLKALGLSLKFYPTQSEARRTYEHVTALFSAVPEFATRVAEWKAMYDTLEVAYTAKTEDISAALTAKFTDESDRATFLSNFNAAQLNVRINYQAAERIVCASNGTSYDPVDDLKVWQNFPSLVAWIPGTFEESAIPAEQPTEIVSSAEREAEILASINPA